MKADWTNRDDAIARSSPPTAATASPSTCSTAPAREPHLFPELLTRDRPARARRERGRAGSRE